MKATSTNGVGPKVAGQLAKAGVASVRDLLFHLLLRYQDRTHGSAGRRLETQH